MLEDMEGLISTGMMSYDDFAQWSISKTVIRHVLEY